MSHQSTPEIAIGDKSFTGAELAAANDELRSAIDAADRDFDDATSPFYQDETHRFLVVLDANRKFRLFAGDGVLHVQVQMQREAPEMISIEPRVGKGGGQTMRPPRRRFFRARG
ncbi:MAG: hypothetical protein ACRDHN_15900 [Thermomicrobiales bacterium]